MPLSNTNYLSSAIVGNVVENWIIQLGFFNGDAQGKAKGAGMRFFRLMEAQIY